MIRLLADRWQNGKVSAITPRQAFRKKLHLT